MRVLVTCLTMWSLVAKTGMQWPGKGGIKGLEVTMGAKSLLILEKESGTIKWRCEFEIEQKEKVQKGDGIKCGMLVEACKRLTYWFNSNVRSCDIHL